MSRRRQQKLSLLGAAAHGQRDESCRDQTGASAVEYALLIAGIAAVIVIAIFALGPITKELFTDTCDEIDEQSSVAASCS